jgi:hypothetical protein
VNLTCLRARAQLAMIRGGLFVATRVGLTIVPPARSTQLAIPLSATPIAPANAGSRSGVGRQHKSAAVIQISSVVRIA